MTLQSLSRVVALNAQTSPSPFRVIKFNRYGEPNVHKTKGAFSRFVQCDVDVVGSTAPHTDAEILT
jgi:histidyl-tRNA synthetase